MRRLFLLSALALAPAFAEASYEIERYIATLEMRDGNADVDVTLDITYRILSGAKADGFKYVGHFEPSELRGTLDTGEAIEVGLKSQRENQVYWRFAESGPGLRRVIVQFHLAGAVSGSRDGDRLEAPWIGVFKVPVRHAEYRVEFPAGFASNAITTEPAGFIQSRSGNRDVLTKTEEPLENRDLTVNFQPGFVTARKRSSGGPGALMIVIILVIVGLFIAAFNRTGNRGDGASSAGGCGGGCSGGGCGGGGCGGGCGG